MRTPRIVPLAILAGLTGSYLLVRPLVAPNVPHLDIVEFPVAVVVGAACVLASIRSPRRAKTRPDRPWRRHRQVVRALPDPELAAHGAALETWARTGRSADEAAHVLALATGKEQGEAIVSAANERQRRALLSNLSKNVKSGT